MPTRDGRGTTASLLHWSWGRSRRTRRWPFGFRGRAFASVRHRLPHARKCFGGRGCRAGRLVAVAVFRSEERRVGKECRSRWGRQHSKKMELEVVSIIVCLLLVSWLRRAVESW